MVYFVLQYSSCKLLQRNKPLGQFMITIKKYRNRRLYDTSESKYVNLDDLAELVRAEQEFEVRDVTTGEDITRQVLTQIIMEGAKGSESEMPIEFLRQLIASTGQARHDLMNRYTTFVTAMYQRAQHEFRDRFQAGETEGGQNPLEVLQRLVPTGSMDSMWNFANRSQEKESKNTETNTASELQAMRQRIEELEQAMKATPAAGVETEEDVS